MLSNAIKFTKEGIITIEVGWKCDNLKCNHKSHHLPDELVEEADLFQNIDSNVIKSSPDSSVNNKQKPKILRLQHVKYEFENETI